MSNLYCTNGEECYQAACTSEYQRCRHDKEYSVFQSTSKQDLFEMVQTLRAQLAEAEKKLATATGRLNSLATAVLMDNGGGAA